MSNPKRAKETISLIEDFTRAPGVVEWFIPFMQQQIADLEREIFDTATSPEDTAKLKAKRETLLQVLNYPAEQTAAHANNLSSFVRDQTGTRETT